MIAAIIQARMGSSRLPGKIMLSACGKSLLYHLLERVKKSKKLEKIIIATTTEPEDDVIVNFCKSEKIDFFRGSKNDVLSRYYETAKKFSVDIIVRLTSDTPLIDPNVIDKVISAYENEHSDYVSNFFPLPRTYPEGYNVEVFPFKILEKTNFEATKPSDREHVTTYISMQPNLFKIFRVDNETDYSKYRFTLDYEDDYKLIKKIYEILYEKTPFFSLNDIVSLVEKNPELLNLNSHIKPYENLIKSFENDKTLGFENHKNNFYLDYK